MANERSNPSKLEYNEKKWKLSIDGERKRWKWNEMKKLEIMEVKHSMCFHSHTEILVAVNRRRLLFKTLNSLAIESIGEWEIDEEREREREREREDLIVRGGFVAVIRPIVESDKGQWFDKS